MPGQPSLYSLARTDEGGVLPIAVVDSRIHIRHSAVPGIHSAGIIRGIIVIEWYELRTAGSIRVGSYQTCEFQRAVNNSAARDRRISKYSFMILRAIDTGQCAGYCVNASFRLNFAGKVHRRMRRPIDDYPNKEVPGDINGEENDEQEDRERKSGFDEGCAAFPKCAASSLAGGRWPSMSNRESYHVTL